MFAGLTRQISFYWGCGCSKSWESWDRDQREAPAREKAHSCKKSNAILKRKKKQQVNEYFLCVWSADKHPTFLGLLAACVPAPRRWYED